MTASTWVSWCWMWILKEISLPLPVCNCFSCVWLFATLPLLCPWDSPGKNTGVSCHALPQRVFSNLELNRCLMSAALTGGFFTISTTWEAPLFGLMLFSIWEQRRQWHPTPVLLPGKSHRWRSLVGYVHRVAKSRTRLSDFTFTFHFHALEKEMATHSCSCLENPRNGGAWWAAIYGVTQSQTRLKQLSSSSIWKNEPFFIFSVNMSPSETDISNNRNISFAHFWLLLQHI